MSKKNKKILYYKIRSRYQLKRLTKNWKKRKFHAKIRRSEKIETQINYQSKPYENHPAPKNMSFVDNTDKVLDYFNGAHELFKKKEKVEFDISEIEYFTPDAITLMIAKLKDENYTKKGRYIGNAPKDKDLKKLFTESGFYNFVATSKQNRNNGNNNLLHKETDYKVRPVIAKNACIVGMNHSLQTCEPFEPLYEILIECMQNTNNHASSTDKEKCKWWLFVYNDKSTGISKYSFLDLGVGIFESLIVKNFINKAVKSIGLKPNTHFVKDLLNGNIQSRIDKDNEIRGKGIPQIVKHSKAKEFKEFKIITNDVIIDLKNKTHNKLKNNFSGTFYYWELQKQ